MRYNSSGRNGLIDVEKSILRLYDNNISIKQITTRLGFSNSTVYSYLKKNGRRRQRNHRVCRASFSNFTPESCYWAGFIAADGCVDKKLTNVRVELNIKEKTHLCKLLSFVKDKDPYIATGSKQIVINNKKYLVDYCRADISSTILIKDLIRQFNVTPNKSLTLKPPLKIPKKLIKHYIRGYFDGDGTIYWHSSHKCNVFGICSGSFKLLDWISNNIKDQVNYPFTDKALRPVKNRSIFGIRCNYSSANQVFKWLYSDSTEDIRLDRKYNKYII